MIFQFTKLKFFKLYLVLLADLNQAQMLLSNLKQLVEKQNDEISQLHNKAVKLETANEMLRDTNIELLVKKEMIENDSGLTGIK